MNNGNAPRAITDEWVTSRDIVALASEISGLKSQMNELIDLVKVQSIKKDFVMANIKIDRKTLMSLLGVSQTTVYRWRRGENGTGYQMPYYVNEDGSTYYLLHEIFGAVRTGQLQAKGFKRLDALRRMVAYQEGSANGYMIASQYQFDNDEFLNRIDDECEAAHIGLD